MKNATLPKENGQTIEKGRLNEGDLRIEALLNSYILQHGVITPQKEGSAQQKKEGSHLRDVPIPWTDVLTLQTDVSARQRDSLAPPVDNPA